MKVKIKVEQEFELHLLHVCAKVRYWEDGQLNGEYESADGKMPFRRGDNWEPTIDIDKGFIIGWPEGTTASIHYKVCDQFGFSITDEKASIILEGDDMYVPGTMCPKEPGYGDYIIMEIDEKGTIQNWKFKLADFQPE